MENKNENKTQENRNDSIPPVYIYTLGGLGEVGKNISALEMGNEIWIIDSGIKFDSDATAIDAVINSYEHLKANEHKIKGLLITHGHEDHIGAVPHLLNAVKVPKIYAGKLAAHMIFHKLRERGIGKVPTEIINNKSVIKSRNFQIEVFNVNHSIPDSFGFVVKTKQGTIALTGDFKFDLSPVGTSADILKMATYGKQGIDLLMSDSTNSQVEKWSPSEAKVAETIDEIVSEAEGRIIVATFASNVYRVREILAAGLKYKRKIALIGYSMDKNTTIARRIKYINVPDEQFINPRHVKNYDPSEIMIVCTGTQGEPNAALSKMSDGRSKEVKINSTDTVAFASSAIPGNYESVEKVTNRLIKLGATVYNQANKPGIHASGHASEEEQLLMLSLFKPRQFMPIHGEEVMLAKHTETAIKSGVSRKNTFIMSNGARLKMVAGRVSRAGAVPAEDVFVDDSSLSGQSAKVVSDRHVMSANGIVTITVGIDSSKNKITVDPKLNSRGALNEQTNKDLVVKIENKVKEQLEKFYASDEKVTFGKIKEIIRSTAEGWMVEDKRINPIVVPIILNEAPQQPQQTDNK